MPTSNPIPRAEFAGPDAALSLLRASTDALLDPQVLLVAAKDSAGQAGQVQINDGAFNICAPFGGYRQSGNGRELGKWGLEEFLETKSMQLP